MTQWQWNPETYLEEMRASVPGFEELEERAAAATAGDASELLELGIGTGETARRVLAMHRGAHLTAIDASRAMLERAKRVVPEADLRLGRLEDSLPAGPFDLVYSTLAVHHLDATGKRALFGRVASVLRPGGRFVLADVVVPPDPADQQIEIDWVIDLPDTLEDQLLWLRDVGFEARPTWKWKDLAVISATLRTAVVIRRARPDEGERLREIAILSKAYWGYDLEFVRSWAAAGDFSADGLHAKEVYVGEADGQAIAWAALIARGDVMWLDDLWVDPIWIGKGVGSHLFRHVVERARALGGTRLEWQAEPNSIGFYEKVGGLYLRDGEPTS